MSTLRRRIAVASLLLLTPALAACTNGFGEQTDKQYQPAVGVNDHDGTVDILDAVVVTDGGQSGTLSVSLVNSGDDSDTLDGVTGPNATGSGPSIDLPPHRLVNLATKGQISVSGPQVKAGSWVKLTLSFASGQSSTVSVPVVNRSGEFAEVPMASASPSAG